MNWQVFEEFVEVGLYVVQAGFDVMFGFFGVKVQVQDLLVSVVYVVFYFFDGFGGDGSQGFIGGFQQSGVEIVLVVGEKQLVGDGLVKVIVFLFN